MLTPETLGHWAVGIQEDEPDEGFIGEWGGDICFVDGLEYNQALIIVHAHNSRMTELERQLAEARQLLSMLEYDEWGIPICWPEKNYVDAALAAAREGERSSAHEVGGQSPAHEAAREEADE